MEGTHLVTILEALAWGEKQLKSTAHEKKQYEPNAKLEAQLLLAHSLNKGKSYLIGHLEDHVSAAIWDRYQRLVHRRKRHEPISHLTGNQPFYGRDFLVGQNVLTPRAETEQLIDLALSRIQNRSHIVDIGTGSGAIAVTMAAETKLPVIAIDTSLNALQTAKANALKHAVDQLIDFRHGHLLAPFLDGHPGATHLVLLANLPYVPANQKHELDPDVMHYEPHEALFSGVDGLELIHELLETIAKQKEAIAPHIDAFFEIDPSQVDALQHLLRDLRLPGEIITDYAGRARFLYLSLS